MHKRRCVLGQSQSLLTPLAHALYIPLSLSPYLPTPGSFIRPRWRFIEQYTEGPPISERSGEGGSSLPGTTSTHGGAGTPNEGSLGLASNTKGPLVRRTCTPKTAMTPVVATITLCGIYKSAPRWRKPANDGSKTSCTISYFIKIDSRF